MIDPFHGGISLGPAELRELLKSFSGLDAELEPRHYRPSSEVDILLRLQNNIKVRALRAGELALATRVIEHSLLIAPDHEGLWHQLGALYSRLDKDHKALGAFEQFVKRCKDPLHRARIEAVIEELRDRLRHDVAPSADTSDDQPPSEISNGNDADQTAKSTDPIPLFPDRTP
jgi:regulator of sirC expression with transglutaminase-like and TPR domain